MCPAAPPPGRLPGLSTHDLLQFLSGRVWSCFLAGDQSKHMGRNGKECDLGRIMKENGREYKNNRFHIKEERLKYKINNE